MYAQNESVLATYEASDAIQQGEIIDNQTGFGDADCMARNGFIGSLDECRRHIAQEHPTGDGANFANSTLLDSSISFPFSYPYFSVRLLWYANARVWLGVAW